MDSTLRRTWAEIDMDALAHNYETLRKRIGENVKFLGVVKADAYGHGANVIAEHYEKYIDRIGVASLEEGIELRSSGIKMPILILGYTSPNQYELLILNRPFGRFFLYYFFPVVLKRHLMFTI